MLSGPLSRTEYYISTIIENTKIMKTFRDLCITMTMRLVAAGHALREAEELAALVVLQLVLLCTLLRHRGVLPGGPGLPDRTVPGWCRSIPRGVHAFLPAAAGTAGVPALFSE